jgi:hypothetical protein
VSGLKSIVIPSSVVHLGKQCFYKCIGLEFAIFENGSRLERIDESVFSYSGLKSIEIPLNVSFIHELAFAGIAVRVHESG